MPTQLNTPEESANKLRVGRSTVFKLIKSGELRSVQIRRRRFITDEAIAEYVARLEGVA